MGETYFAGISNWLSPHGPLARYVKLRVAHMPRMPGTFSPPPRVSDPNMHHGTCVTHVPWCMPGSLTSRFLCNGWRGKRSWHSRRKRNPQFCVSSKRPIELMAWHLHEQSDNLRVHRANGLQNSMKRFQPNYIYMLFVSTNTVCKYIDAKYDKRDFQQVYIMDEYKWG